jgi:hypothetical protein
MPLCPQITITPVTVTSTNMTQTSVIAANAPATTEQLTTVSDSVAAALAAAAAADAAAAAAQADADAAQASAATAQADATEALADAATAYTAAIGSLQPSANTIVNASNQMTAINSTGITVYSGASATSGARVVLNSAGLAGFNSGGTATFSVSASTGAAVFSGSVTGATITGGTLNIGGNAIIDASGLLTATGATITGAVNATSGYFGSATNGYSISSTGLVGIGTGVIIGGQIQTSSGGTSVGLIGSTNSLSFKNGGSYVGHIVPLSSNGVLMHYGAAADGSGGTFPQMYVGSGNVSMFASTTCGIGVSTIVSLVGDAYARQRFYVEDTSIATTAPNGRIDSDGRVRRTTGSSVRFKENIVDLGTVGDMAPQQLLTLPVRAFTFKPDYLDAADNRVGVPVPGFIAEEVSEHYPAAADYDAEGNPENWNERFLIPGMLALIQDLYKEIELLKGA